MELDAEHQGEYPRDNHPPVDEQMGIVGLLEEQIDADATIGAVGLSVLVALDKNIVVAEKADTTADDVVDIEAEEDNAGVEETVLSQEDYFVGVGVVVGLDFGFRAGEMDSAAAVNWCSV